MKKQSIHTGCSAYNNGYWKGIFYPEGIPRSKWFEFYCEHFNTYEINATFYRFPTVKSLQAWYLKAPENFEFAVKAPKIITHFKQFTDCRQEADEFYNICREGLGDKLSHILFQLPPSLGYTPYRLALILSYINADFTNVIEFRNETWWCQEVYDALKEKGVIFCNVSYPKLPTKLVQTSTKGYFRLHGVPRLFYSDYTKEELQQLLETIRAANWKQVHIYFNNTARTAGILDAVEMKELASKK